MRAVTLRTSLILLMVVATVLTFCIVGGVLLFIRLPQVEAGARTQLQEQAHSTSRLLDDLMVGVERQLEPLVRLERIGVTTGRQSLLDAMVPDDGVFDAVFILDRHGTVSALGLPTQFRAAADELRGADFSQSALFQAMVEGSAVSGPAAPRIVWSDKYLSALAGKHTVAVAIRAGERTVIGETSLDRILHVLQSAARHGGARVTVFDGQGQWLISTETEPSPTVKFSNYSALPSFRAVRDGTAMPEYEQVHGSRSLVGAATSAKLGWVIAATTPAGWHYLPYRTTILLVVGGFIGSLVISVALAPFWAARMARPLRVLIDRAHAVAQGNLGAPWPREAGVLELNQLSRDLAMMVATIQNQGERMRATLEGTPSVGIQWFSAQGTVLYWNRASELMYGFSSDEALHVDLHHHPLMFLGADHVAGFLQMLDSIARSGKSLGPAEFPLRHKDGRAITVLATLFAIPGEPGENGICAPIFVCMDIDITEQIRSQAALQDSEYRLETIFNASPAAMSVSDAGDGFKILSVNSAWERQFRRDRSAVVGRTGPELNLWAHLDERDSFLARLQNEGGVAETEATLLTGDGRPLLCDTTALIAQIGGERLLLMMSVDITERRRTELALHELNTRLEARVTERTEALGQANEELAATVEHLKSTQEQLVRSAKLAALGNLVAGIAHELNTPIGNGLLAISTLRDNLTSLRAAMSTGLKRQDLSDFMETVGKGSEIAQRSLTQAAELVTSFRQVAVDQAGSQRRRFQLRELLRETLLMLNPILKHTAYRVITELPEDLELDSFPGALGQILSHLINNSVIHGFEGRPQGTVHVTARPEGPGKLRLVVRDDGQGIPAANLARIFDPFFTTRMGRGGTGLGLHVLHGLVTDVLGGTVSVTSIEGQGCEFSMLIPVVAPRASRAA